MPNKNYLAGRRMEWERKKYWESNGFIVLRTAGSHGFADLIAIIPPAAPVFIQCKKTKSEALAKKMILQFEAEPPLEPGNYWQILEVKIPRKGILVGKVSPKHKM